MAFANYGYSELYSTAVKDRSESKGRSNFFSVLGESVAQTIENEIRFDISFTCKGRPERSKDRPVYFVLHDKFNAFI